MIFIVCILHIPNAFRPVRRRRSNTDLAKYPMFLPTPSMPGALWALINRTTICCEIELYLLNVRTVQSRRHLGHCGRDITHDTVFRSSSKGNRRDLGAHLLYVFIIGRLYDPWHMHFE